MNKLTIISAFLLNLVVYSTTAPPRTNSTLLHTLIDSESNPLLKCSYMRSLLLNGTEYTFLNECPATVDPKKNNEIMCTVFLNNFLKLCSLSSSFDNQSLLNNSTIRASYDINVTCSNLITIEPVNASFDTILGHITKYLEGNCPGICKSFLDEKTLPICAISGWMNNISKQIKTNFDKVKKENKKGEKVQEKIQKAVLISDIKGKSIDEVKDKSVDIPKDEEAIILKNTPPVKKPPVQIQPQIQPQNQPKNQNVQNPVENQSENQPEHSPIPNVDENVQNNSENVDKIPKVVEKIVAPPNVDLKKSDKDKNESGDVKATKKINEVVNLKSKEEHHEKVDEETVMKKNEVVVDKVDDKVPDKADPEIEVKDDNPENDGSDDVIDDDDDDLQDVNQKDIQKYVEDTKKSIPKPKNLIEDTLNPVNANSDQIEEEDSFFFVYFMMVCAVFILGYIGYHNKQKVLALVIEGRRGRRSSRRGGRPNSANYHKLDSNLEEAVTSSVHKNTTNIIY